MIAAQRTRHVVIVECDVAKLSPAQLDVLLKALAVCPDVSFRVEAVPPPLAGVISGVIPEGTIVIHRTANNMLATEGSGAHA